MSLLHITAVCPTCKRMHQVDLDTAYQLHRRVIEIAELPITMICPDCTPAVIEHSNEEVTHGLPEM